MAAGDRARDPPRDPGRGRLGSALRTLARRSPIPVGRGVDAEERLPELVEVAAYDVVAEALTNAARYAGASNRSRGRGRARRLVRVAVRDDGRGGADPARASGLLGLKDRVEAKRLDLAAEFAREGHADRRIAGRRPDSIGRRCRSPAARPARSPVPRVIRPRSTPSLQLVGSPGLQQTCSHNGCWPQRQHTAPARSSTRKTSRTGPTSLTRVRSFGPA
jgi:hypothetical protein